MNLDDQAAIRQKLIELSPDIRADVNRVADLLRQLVDTEREKLHLNHLGGRLTLEPYKKMVDSDPDLIGSGRIAARVYQAAAWIDHNGLKINISLLPKNAT